jgi:hypothetical protein
LFGKIGCAVMSDFAGDGKGMQTGQGISPKAETMVRLL